MPKHNYPFSLCLRGAAGLSTEWQLEASAYITPGTLEAPATVEVRSIDIYDGKGVLQKNFTLDTLLWNHPGLNTAIYEDWKAGQS